MYSGIPEDITMLVSTLCVRFYDVRIQTIKIKTQIILLYFVLCVLRGFEASVYVVQIVTASTHWQHCILCKEYPSLTPHYFKNQYTYFIFMRFFCWGLILYYKIKQAF